MSNNAQMIANAINLSVSQFNTFLENGGYEEAQKQNGKQFTLIEYVLSTADAESTRIFDSFKESNDNPKVYEFTLALIQAFPQILLEDIPDESSDGKSEIKQPFQAVLLAFPYSLAGLYIQKCVEQGYMQQQDDGTIVIS